jgi:hypothetical protein
MLLSIICPKISKGMSQMLERELKDIEHEIIKNIWSTGLPKAKGSFVCLLEPDSAVEKNSIIENLKIFTDNPSYRKLAMVSPTVDFEDIGEKLIFSWNNGVKGYHASQLRSIRDCRIGYVPGAIIRRTSLLKSNLNHMLDPLRFTTDVSFDFWSRGLRISVNPETVYYAPINGKQKKYRDKLVPNQDVIKIWEHEMIS